jgi:hypothetical protein
LDTKEGLKWGQMKLDINKRQNINESFSLCHEANNCINLSEGKLFTCCTIPYIKHFNEYFNVNLIVSAADYIDIYKIDSLDEILDRLSKPIPFCGYCNQKIKTKLNWSISKKEITEWI